MDGHTHTQHLDTLTPNFLSKLILSSQNESKVKVANSLQGARGGGSNFFFHYLDMEFGVEWELDNVLQTVKIRIPIVYLQILLECQFSYLKVKSPTLLDFNTKDSFRI